MRTKALPLRLRRFVDAYLGSCAGNGAASAIAAGYARGSAKVTASRVLTKANVRAAIEARLKRDTDNAIASADERDRLLSEAMRASGEEWLVRIRAIAELNKVTGRHAMKLTHDVGESLYELLGGRPLPTVEPRKELKP